MSHKKHKKYWKRFLLPDENIIHLFGVSKRYIVVFWIIPAFALFVLMIFMGSISIILGVLMAFAFLSTTLPIIYLRYFVHYAITDQRVMTREGILHKEFITADLPSVTDITVNESFFERVLARTGEIGVNTAGSDFVELHFRHVRKPLLIRSDIYKHQNNWRANGEARNNGQVKASNSQ